MYYPVLGERWTLIHKAPAHYGYPPDRYKIIYYYNDGAHVKGSGSIATPRSGSPRQDLRADPESSTTCTATRLTSISESAENSDVARQARLEQLPTPHQSTGPRPQSPGS